jgi:hypothetical protein
MAGIGFSTDLDQRLQEIEIEANGAADDVCPLACGMCSKPKCVAQAFAAQPAGWCGPRFPKSRGSPAETPSYRVHRFTVIRSYDIYLKAQRGEGACSPRLESQRHRDTACVSVTRPDGNRCRRSLASRTQWAGAPRADGP